MRISIARPRPMRIVLACIGLAGLLLQTAAPAAACTPPPGGPMRFSVLERAESADIVVWGQVVATETGITPFPEIATIDVRLYFKGGGGDELVVSGYGPGSLCRTSVEVGDPPMIFFVEYAGDGSLTAHYRGQFDATAPATDENLATLRARYLPSEPVYLPFAIRTH